MVDEIPRAILENRALPDWGEPMDPIRRRTWTQRLLGMPRRVSRPQGAGAPAGAKGTVLKIK